MESLAGKTALVTGAGKGIGRALVLALAREGVHVGLVSRTVSDLEEVAREVQDLGVRAVVASADVSDLASVEAAAGNIRKELGN
ncbi:MAG TPA: SDR family NAD(P)-dependent oxidoreductase, partial [Sphingobacteriaceae bacterium]